MLDERCRSDQPVLPVIPVVLEYTVVFRATDSLLERGAE